MIFSFLQNGRVSWILFLFNSETRFEQSESHYAALSPAQPKHGGTAKKTAAGPVQFPFILLHPDGLPGCERPPEGDPPQLRASSCFALAIPSSRLSRINPDGPPHWRRISSSSRPRRSPRTRSSTHRRRRPFPDSGKIRTRVRLSFRKHRALPKRWINIFFIGKKNRKQSAILYPLEHSPEG